MRRIVTGIQPTNDLTLGNYFGAIKTLIQSLKPDDELFLFVADMHSITLGNFNQQTLEANKKNIVKHYLAAGLNLENVYIFYQSSILEICNLTHILTCASTIGELSRMTQFKDKSTKVIRQDNGTEKIPTGLLTYPLLMAADILIYDADLVIVGNDQKQHLELTRNLAERINNLLKTKNLLKVPEIFVSKTTARIMDLQNPETKMSKSSQDQKGVIFLNDDIKQTLKKIKSAKTDCDNCVYYDKKNKPGVSNLISIYSALTDKTIDQIQQEFKNQNYGVFKEAISNSLEKFLVNYQEKFKTISDQEVMSVLIKGTNKAKQIANEKLKQIFNKVGFN